MVRSLATVAGVRGGKAAAGVAARGDPEAGTAAAASPSAVVGAALRLLAHRDRASALAPWAPAAGAGPTRPVTLQAAIERDFALFDVERAEADLRAALAALCGAPAAAAPPPTCCP